MYVIFISSAAEANGRVKPKTDSEKSDTAEITEDNEGNSDVNEQKQSSPMNMNSIYIVIGVIALGGIGVAGFILAKKKSGSKAAAVTETDDEREEVYIKEDEEEFNFYDENQDE